MLSSADTKVRGRFSEKRGGPSRPCARNASAALENFVCLPEKTFSTASVKIGSGRARAARPFYPQQQTSSGCSAPSEKCQIRKNLSSRLDRPSIVGTAQPNSLSH